MISTPRKQAPKDRGKPFEHTKSPSRHIELKRLWSKAIMAVVRWLEKEVLASDIAKR